MPIAGPVVSAWPPWGPTVLPKQHEDVGMPLHRRAPPKGPGRAGLFSRPWVHAQVVRIHWRTQLGIFLSLLRWLAKCHLFLKKLPLIWCIFHFPGFPHTLLSPSAARSRGNSQVATCWAAALDILSVQVSVSALEPEGPAILTWGRSLVWGRGSRFGTLSC